MHTVRVVPVVAAILVLTSPLSAQRSRKAHERKPESAPVTVTDPHTVVDEMSGDHVATVTLAALRDAPATHTGTFTIVDVRIVGVARADTELFVLDVVQPATATQVGGFNRNALSIIVRDGSLGRDIAVNAELSNKYLQHLLVDVQQLPAALGRGYVAVVKYVRWIDENGSTVLELPAE